MSKQLLEAINTNHYDYVMQLLAKGNYDLDVRDAQGRTALHLAAAKGYDKVVKILHGLGLNVDDNANGFGTALLDAAASGKTSTIQLLLDLEADILALDEDGLSTLHWALDGKHLETFQILVANCNTSTKKKLLSLTRGSEANSILHEVVENDSKLNLEATRTLLQSNGKLINLKNNSGRSPLHIAAGSGALLQARLLIQRGANNALLDDEELTPLALAQMFEHRRLATFLATPYIDNTASDTDSEDEDDYTFIPVLFSSRQPKSKIVNRAVFKGVLPNGIELTFHEEFITPNGDCGFIGLGADRNQVSSILIGRADDIDVREAIWLEIAEALLSGDFKTENSDTIIYESFEQKNEKIEDFKEFCTEKTVFIQYMESMGQDNNLWLGYQTAIEFSKCKNISLYIWCENDSTLTLTRYHEAQNTEQTIHLLHTASYTHFNFLVINNPTEELEKAFSNLKTDSPPRTPTKIETKEKNKNHHLAHYRGLHFYPDHYSRKQRYNMRQIHLMQQQEVLPRTGLYSGATHELAEIPFSMPEIQGQASLKNVTTELLDRERKLTTANQTIVDAMVALQKTGRVQPCLQHEGNKSSRGNGDYESRYMEYVQRYVNSYKTFMEDMNKAPFKNLEDGRMQSKREKWTILKNLGFSKLPFVSTSEEAHWALEYACALVNWDKKTTHQPRVDGVSPLAPVYLPDGHARFPYLGIVYATLHMPKELTETNSTRIIDLFVEDLIDTKCASPGGHVTGGYIRAKERIFIGGVDPENITFSIVIRVPNFYKDYQSFYKEKYGLSEQKYNEHKQHLATYGAIVGHEGKMRNEQTFHRTEQKIIEWVIDHEKSKLEATIIEFLESKEGKLVYYGARRNEIQDTSLDIDKCVDAREKKKGKKLF
jgi:ankyrin repeat protein